MEIPGYLEHAYSMLPSEQHNVALAVHDKGKYAAANVAIGDILKVRRTKNTFVTGKILAARVHKLRITQASVCAIFEVDMECGIAKVFKQVYIRRIPTIL